MSVLVDPHDPWQGLGDLADVLSLLASIRYLRLSPASERGRLILLKMALNSVVALVRHIGLDDHDGLL